MSESVKVVRHGDVILVRLDSAPSGLEFSDVPADNGRTVLAYGEVTGHSHALKASEATLVKTKHSPKVSSWLKGIVKNVGNVESCIAANGNEIEFLNVVKNGAVLDHQEHPPVALDEGCYLVIHQQEYSPGEVKQVRD